jgi:hypothetical protein
MCQKATGGPFGAYVTFAAASVAWTRGERSAFQSSDAILRGFCRDCGTPLTFEAAGSGERMSITLGAFDDPDAIAPQRQLEPEARLSWVASIAELPSPSPDDLAARAAKYPPVVSRQHPDHDTDTWPVQAG